MFVLRLKALSTNPKPFCSLETLFFYSTTKTMNTKPRMGSIRSLYRRLSPLGDPTVSIVPVLDQWVKEGNPVDKEQLHSIVKELRFYKRFTHALQVSMWMTEKRYLKFSSSELSVRLDLVSKVHGLEKAEEYFNLIPEHLKGLEIYSTLLNCYTNSRCVENAEAIMQKMKDLGLAKRSLAFNVLLNLYHKTGNYEKLDALSQEMDEKGVRFDAYTYGILLSAHVAKSNIDGIEKIVKRIGLDHRVKPDWSFYSIVANGYTKLGQMDKAIAALRTCEELIPDKKKDVEAYHFLLTQYAGMGKKDEVLRLCEVYRKKESIFNKGYKIILASLLKVDQIDTAEGIFDDWLSRGLHYDIRIPNMLIGAYCRKGDLERAEMVIKKVTSRGEKTDEVTLYYMAIGHLRNGETSKAIESLKKGLLVCDRKWVIDNETLAACFKYLKETENLVGGIGFIGLLKDKNILSEDVCNGLLSYMKGDGRCNSIIL